MSHKHCKHCGLDFEPKNQWDEYCPPPKKCVEDYQKVHPPQFQNPNQITVPGWTFPSTAAPGWSFPSTGTGQQWWYCGICGENIPMNESHIHSFTFTAGT